MTIKHLSLCGGGIVGLVMYGIIKRLHELKFWELKNIETIYTCSIGSFIGLMLILDIPWEWLDDFLIKRPWNSIFDFNNIDYFKYIEDKGIFDETIWIKIITPLLKSKQLDPDITLLELYKHTNIELNLYVTDMNTINKQIINYKTFPDIRVSYAIYLTTCIPYIFKPAFYNENCYIDGGLTNNVPINDCLYNNKCTPDEIINITNEISNDINFDLNTKYQINRDIDKLIDNSNNKIKNILQDNSNNTCYQNNKNNTQEDDNQEYDNQEYDNQEDNNNREDDNQEDNNNQEDDNREDNNREDDNQEDDNREDDNREDAKQVGDNQVGDNQVGDNQGGANQEDDNQEDNITLEDSLEDNNPDNNKIQNPEISKLFKNNINNNCNILEFSIYILKNLVKKLIVLNTINNVNIDNTINSCITNLNIDIQLWLKIIYNRDNIANTINYGSIIAEQFLIKKLKINLD